MACGEGMSTRYSVWIERDRTGLYTATHLELPGCRGQGATPEAATSDLDAAREEYLRALTEAGVEPPRPMVLRGGHSELFPHRG